MTTVSQRDGLTLGQALTLWLSGREQLVPRDLVYPPDKSRDEVDNANNQEFKTVRGQRRICGAVVSEVRPGGHRRDGQRTTDRRRASCRRAMPSTRSTEPRWPLWSKFSR